jgi:hypothetical protein
MRSFLVILELVLLSGCANLAVAPAEQAAAYCLRDALAASPWISDAVVAESGHATLVRFTIHYADEHKERGALIVQHDEAAAPTISFRNSIGGFPTDFNIDKLLAERCPNIPDRTPEI